MLVIGSDRSRGTVRALALAAAMVVALLAGTTDARAGTTPVVNTEEPAVVGKARFGKTLEADPGAWTPADAAFAYQWLRDGDPVDGATKRRYRPAVRDIKHRLGVLVTATAGDSSAAATSAEVRVRKGTVRSTKRPTIDGVRRYTHTLVARPGSWSKRPDRVTYRWMRNGKAITGANGRRHNLGLSDFGKRISVRVTVRKEGYRKARASSRRTAPIMHRVPARHTVTYSVETRGRITADPAVFRRQAQATYDDPRGWRGSGIAFRRVAGGGAFTLVLAEASTVPGFSSGCSAQWSCRVGRYVVINQLRWMNASPMWHQAGRPLRGYRHMVVNHETGHWLGHGHRSCPGGGATAPVMQQQSKGLDGCRPNPWPTSAERDVPRF
jgi:hypothetical protein